MRMQVRSLASLSGLRIQCCRELWYRPATICPLAWEPPFASGMALKRKRKKIFTLIMHLEKAGKTDDTGAASPWDTRAGCGLRYSWTSMKVPPSALYWTLPWIGHRWQFLHHCIGVLRHWGWHSSAVFLDLLLTLLVRTCSLSFRVINVWFNLPVSQYLAKWL